MQTQIRRVLIYRLGSLGDTVIALPALHLVAREFPLAERHMVTNVPVSAKAPAAAAILADSGLVHGYFRYQVSTRSLRALFALWWSVLRWRPQVLIYLGSARGVESARRDARFFRMCGVWRQIGVPVTEAMQASLPQQPGGTFEPECERLVRNLAELGRSAIETPEAWDLHLTEAERDHADTGLQPAGGRPILAVSMGTKMQSKDWGRDNWRALLARLGEHFPDYALVLFGVEQENEASVFAAEGWLQGAGRQALVVNLCGRMNPRESAACFVRARLFLGLDSGPMHLAAAFGTPCVAIFAARNVPRVWFPHGAGHRVIYHAVECMGCGLETCTVERKRCLTSISVAEVEAEVCAALAIPVLT